MSGRLTAIGDVFDALTSVRPYKKEWPVDDALNLISEGAGEHFDPTLAPLFVSLKPELVKIKELYKDTHE